VAERPFESDSEDGVGNVSDQSIIVDKVLTCCSQP
jgi:hypothetical protein